MQQYESNIELLCLEPNMESHAYDTMSLLLTC